MLDVLISFTEDEAREYLSYILPADEQPTVELLKEQILADLGRKRVARALQKRKKIKDQIYRLQSQL